MRYRTYKLKSLEKLGSGARAKSSCLHWTVLVNFFLEKYILWLSMEITKLDFQSNLKKKTVKVKLEKL